jgi:hypothetical protein
VAPDDRRDHTEAAPQPEATPSPEAPLSLEGESPVELALPHESLPPHETADDLGVLLAALPPEIVDAIHALADQEDLIEVVMDLGRRPEARYPD